MNTDIVEDLGVWGDDCEEFFVKFCEKFNVECKKIDINRCGSEGIFFPCIGSLNLFIKFDWYYSIVQKGIWIYT